MSKSQGKQVSDQKRKRLIDILGLDLATKVIDGTEQASKAIEEAGIAFKSKASETAIVTEGSEEHIDLMAEQLGVPDAVLNAMYWELPKETILRIMRRAGGDEKARRQQGELSSEESFFKLPAASSKARSAADGSAVENVDRFWGVKVHKAPARKEGPTDPFWGVKVW